MQHHVGEVDIAELVAVEDTFRAARQTFAFTRVTGTFVLGPVAGGHAVIPAAVPGDGISLAIEAVRLFPVVLFHQIVSIGVLRIARVEVALTAVTGFKLQRLHRREIPAHDAVNILIFHPFTPGRHGIGIGAGTLGLMSVVDIPGIGLGFVEVAQQAEAEIAPQRAAEAKVGAFSRTFVFMLRGVHVGIP